MVAVYVYRSVGGTLVPLRIVGNYKEWEGCFCLIEGNG